MRLAPSDIQQMNEQQQALSEFRSTVRPALPVWLVRLADWSYPYPAFVALAVVYALIARELAIAFGAID